MSTTLNKRIFLLLIIFTIFVTSGMPAVAGAQEIPLPPHLQDSTGPQSQADCDAEFGGPGKATFETSSSGQTSCRPAGANSSDDSSGPAVCTGIVSCIMWLPNALFKGMVTLLAGVLIYMSTWILSISALLFNWLVENTIIQFGTFYGTIKVAVETAWTAFRDIANILIIGIFTFVAISIIVGLKEYGQKKMIAHVLIVAVLINFSLLFTKMVIDASNYTASQIYTAAALGGTNATGSGSPVGATGGATAPRYGIAEQFMYLLGVQTFGKSLKLVSDSGEANGGGIALLHGILVMIVVLGAAMVLFYGSFLLISRMIMLIFLLVTAAIAVGSSLIPGWGGGNYGWKAWKNSLLWCVTLAPMLMILLWMTLNVSGAIRGAATGTLGEALSNPTSGSNISALFSYALILGLLFTTFKVSSMWASKIGGFNMASMAAALPLTLGSRFIAAPLLRQTAGWLGTKYQGARLGEMKDARTKASVLRQQEREAFKNMSPMAAKYGADARKFEQLAADKLKAAKKGAVFAEGKMNLMDTPAMKAALGQVGIKGFAAGASTKDTNSYETQQKIRAEAAEKLAAKAAPSGDDNEKARKEARQVVRDQRQTAEAQLEATRRAAETTAQQIKETQQLPSKLAAAQQNASNIADDANAEKVRIAANTTLSATDQKRLLDVQENRITAAQKDVQQIQRGITAAEGPWREAEEALKAHRKKTGELAKEAEEVAVEALKESTANIAEAVGRDSGDILTRAIGSVTGANEEVGKKTKDIYKKKIKTAGIRDALADLQGDAKPAAPAAPPPAAPHP